MLHGRLDDLSAGERSRAACKPSCDACCHYLVPVSPAEARRLRERLTPASAARLRAVRRQLESAGLLELLDDVAAAPPDARAWLSDAYADERLACPFLEAGRCSVYADRPAACRLHLSTDAAACHAGLGSTLTPLRVNGRPATRALAELEEGDWLPLISLNAVPDARPIRRSSLEWINELE